MSTPPPPPPPRPENPPATAGWGAPPPPPPSPTVAPAAAWEVAPTKPPRPAVPVGGWLLIAGAVIAIVGTFLNWFSIAGEDINGYTEIDGDTRDGPVFVFLAVVLAGFGIALLAAGRVLAVAILAVVFASFLALGGLADFGDVSDLEDFFGDAVEIGPGLPVVIVGGLVALAGGIVALAKRRR